MVKTIQHPITGETFTHKEWAKKLNISSSALSIRFKRWGNDLEKILSQNSDSWRNGAAKRGGKLSTGSDIVFKTSVMLPEDLVNKLKEKYEFVLDGIIEAIDNFDVKSNNYFYEIPKGICLKRVGIKLTANQLDKINQMMAETSKWSKKLIFTKVILIMTSNLLKEKQEITPAKIIAQKFVSYCLDNV